MRIRYAYKVEFEDGHVGFATLNKKLSEEEVLEKLAPKGAKSVAFHERVRTGYKVIDNGDIVETGLPHKSPDAPKPAPAKASKKPGKSKKA